jgi:hypothetical protein
LGESWSVLATHHDLRDVKVEKVAREHRTHIFVESARGKFVLSASVQDGQRPPFLYQFAAVRALRHHGWPYGALPTITRRGRDFVQHGRFLWTLKRYITSDDRPNWNDHALVVESARILADMHRAGALAELPDLDEQNLDAFYWDVFGFAQH